MNTRHFFALLASLFFILHEIAAQGTAFTYQGRLSDGANTANGNYDLRFDLRDAATGGGSVSTANTIAPVAVSNGLFTVTLNFGAGALDGNARWLEIGVRTNGSIGAYSILSPRQALTGSPYSIFAATASNVVNGVKTLNGLRDSVTLAAGSNVTISPSGNTLTIASAGAGGSGIWSLNGGNAYYNAGNVGIGTASPASTLDVRGNLVLDAGGNPGIFTAASGGEQNRYLSLVNSPNSPTASGLKAGGILVSDDYFLANPGKNDLIVKGNVAIGTATPSKKLTVFSPGFGIEHTDGTVRLASYLNSDGGWLGTISDHNLNFYVNNGQPSMTIDNAGRVGIGTLTPANKLTVFSSLYGIEHTDGTIRLSTYVAGSGGYLGTLSNHKLSFFVNDGAARMTVDTTGNVGIGTITPVSKLEVAGDTRINGQLNINMSGGFTTLSVRARPSDTVPVDIVDSSLNPLFNLQVGPNSLFMYGNASKNAGGTSWGTFSDRRLKQEVREYKNGLNEVLRLRPVRFRYRDGIKPGLTSAQEEVGFIAQEVREVIPDAVTEGKDGYLMLKADPIHWAAINAIQELNTKLEQKDAEVQELRNSLAELKEIVAKLTEQR